MDTASVERSQGKQSLQEQLKSLKKTNFNLRSEVDKLKSENKLLKSQLFQERNESKKLTEVKNSVEQHARKVVCKQELLAIKEKCDIAEKNNANLRRKLSRYSSSFAKNQTRIAELEKKVDRRNSQLKQKTAEIEELNEKVKNKLEELDTVDMQYDGALSRLRKAETTIFKAQQRNQTLETQLKICEDKHSYLLTLTDMQDNTIKGMEEDREKLKNQLKSEQDEKNNAKLELCTLKKEIEQIQINFQEAAAIILQRNKEHQQAEINEQSLDKNDKGIKALDSRFKGNCQQDIIEMQNKKIAEQDAALKDAADFIFQQKEVMKQKENIEIKMNEMHNDKVILETTVKENEREIDQLKKEQDHFLKFVDKIKGCVEFSRYERQFNISQLEQLAGLVEEKMEESEHSVEVKKRKIANHPSSSDVTETNPSDSSNIRSKQKPKHAEDVSKRLPGRGKENLGAKYYCICKFVCATLSRLEYHIKYAPGTSKIVCCVCSKRFGHPRNLKLHMQNSHSRQIPKSMELHVGTRSDRPFTGQTGKAASSQEEPMNTREDEIIINANTSSPPQVAGPLLLMENNDDRLKTNASTTTTTISSVKDYCNAEPIALKKIKCFLKKHGISPDSNNICLCGVPFGSPEALTKHIELRSKRV